MADARRAVAQCAESLGLGETAIAKAALIATELATNLIKHASGGTIVVTADRMRLHPLTIIAIDKGPGMTNVSAAMRDGYSTAGSSGTGLGAATRAAAFSDIYSLPGKGTAILCRVEDDRPSRVTPSLDAPNALNVDGFAVPKSGEHDSGDSWIAVSTRDEVTVLVADGLGHGGAAAVASNEAVRVMQQQRARPLPEILELMHGALRPTRGAAVGVARIFLSHRRLDFAGVGNISGTIVDDASVRKVVSLNGIVGHEMRKVQTFSYPWSATSLLIMHSDGIGTSWHFENYPGLRQHDSALVSAVLYRDHTRGTDDATVVVAKAS